MKPVKAAILAGLLLLPLITFTGCEESVKSLYDPTVTFKPKPIITAIAPAGGGIAGVTELTITGSNFSANPDEVFVYFNGKLGTVLSSTATEIKVRAAVVDLANDTAGVFIRIAGAIEFSDTTKYRLQQAVVTPFPLQEFEEPSALEFDKDGNLYVSVLANQITNNILKITPAGVKTKYTPDAGGGLRYTSLKFGPGGKMYGIRNFQRAIFEIPAGGGASGTFLALTPNTVKLKDMDIDANAHLWLGGDNAALYRVKISDKSVKTYPFAFNVRALKVAGNKLYAAVQQDSSSYIYSFDIDANSDLINQTLYADLTQTYGYNVKVNAIAVDADGFVYVGTDRTDPIVQVTPAGAVSAFYPGVLASYPAIYFAWDNGTNLYYTREAGVSGTTVVPQTVLMIRVLKQGAPAPGRNM